MLEHAENVIDGGGRFTISAASDSGLNGTQTSAFFVDLGNPVSGSFDGNFELIAPDVPGVADSSSPGATDALTDIDVLHATHVGRFEVTGGNFMGTVGFSVPTYAGNQPFQDAAGQTIGFDAAPPTDHTTFGFDLVLQRRLNPNMPALDELVENPWVEVDRIRVMLADFNLTDGAPPIQVFDPADDHKGVGRLKSTQRLEPLNDTLAVSRQLMTQPKTAAVPVAMPHRFNTVKGDSGGIISDSLGVNSGNLVDPTVRGSDANPFTLWQPHFDRDYASTGELLNLPVIGPSLLTQRLDRMRLGSYQQVGDAVSDPNLLSNAAAMFLMPDFTDLMPARPIESAEDNRWYRLLQFVEVPSRVNRMLGNYLALNRLPGKLNPNMIRHREVYAGLIDDPNFATAPVLADAAPQNGAEDGPFLPGLAPLDGTDATPGLSVRDRWHEFINERDGLVTSWDPTAPTPQVANFWIPGTPNSRPFRSFNHMNTFVGSENGGDSTLLRRLGLDLPAGPFINRAGEGSAYTTGVDPGTNRHWLEVGDRPYHRGVAGGVYPEQPCRSISCCRKS
ncbi:MAG: hypothetical protein R3C19_19055 [Planctomycetaceae bacterium]